MIVFFATIAGGGGWGAIALGISALITFYIAFISFTNKSDLKIYPIDWITLTISLISIPIWYFSNNPFWATGILTCIDTIGFLPTIRKSFRNPMEENLLFYCIFILQNLLVVASLETFNWTTLLFPIIVSLDSLILILIVLTIRIQLKEN